MAQPTTTENTGFVRGLNLFDATMIVIGTMIGSGIFIVSADMARMINSPGWLLVAWAVTAALTILAAISYGELAAHAAARRRRVRVPARGVFALVGIPLRLDAVRRDPDRNHRRRRGGLRAIPVRSGSLHFGEPTI